MKKRRTILYMALASFVLVKTGWAQCSLEKVPYSTVSEWTSCTATLTWEPVSGASSYKVKYKIKEASGWIILDNVITTLSFTFTNLIPDTTYKFAVAPVCSNGSTGSYRNAQKKTRKATNPTGFAASNPVGTAITLSWTPVCPVLHYNIRYKVSGTSGWTTVTAATTSSSYIVTGLMPNTLYEFQIQAETHQGTDGWSSSVLLNSGEVPPPPPIVPPKPNFIIYMLDDGRYDNYIPNGGPSWFQTPSINRIAQEGVNFPYAFVTTAQCAPSRVSTYTGLYAHKHGALDNRTRRFDGLYHVQQILRDHGYYTGFVGKFGQFQGDPEGFDWWATSKGNIFINPQYEINNKDTLIPGHISDVYQDLALTFLNSVPAGKKFLLMFYTRIPHLPTTPRPADTNLYLTESMPIPSNMSNYTANYPSFFYNGGGHKWGKSVAQTDSIKRVDFQCLYGAELNMQALLQWLESKGLLDSTMIIFTSDNGYLQGEHNLEAKQIAQEESIRVPMFVRLPAWFPPGSVSNVLVANIDIPATLLDAVGIPDTFGFDGESLYRLFTGQVKRKYFYYQFFGDGNTPHIRAVRSAQYKYVKHYCNSTTEEFFDLTIDPQENTNRINTSSYSAIINTYRAILDSFRTVLNDPQPPVINCQLSNPQYSRELEEEEEVVQRIEIFPNPTENVFQIRFADELREHITLSIRKVTGEIVYTLRVPDANYLFTTIDAQTWGSGIYLVQLHKGDRLFTRLLSLQR